MMGRFISRSRRCTVAKRKEAYRGQKEREAKEERER